MASGPSAELEASVVGADSALVTAWSGLGFWKVFDHFFGGANARLFALSFAALGSSWITPMLVSLLIGAFCAFVPLLPRSSLGVVEGV